MLLWGKGVDIFTGVEFVALIKGNASMERYDRSGLGMLAYLYSTIRIAWPKTRVLYKG